jgi:hypothetical protein
MSAERTSQEVLIWGKLRVPVRGVRCMDHGRSDAGGHAQLELQRRAESVCGQNRPKTLRISAYGL